MKHWQRQWQSLLLPILIVVFGIGIFSGLSAPLWDQDESAYMGFASNMLTAGDWVVPEYPVSSPHRKTPLHFWMGAGIFYLFGENIAYFRLLNVLFFLATGAVVYFFAHSLFPERKDIPRWAGIIFLTGIFLPLYSKIALTDTALLFFQTLAVFSLWKVTEYRPSKILAWPMQWHWVLVFWTMIGLGVLQKGPPILLLACGMAAGILLFSSHRKSLFFLHPWVFLPISLIPLFYWGHLAWQATQGKFILWLVDWYILKRAGGAVFGQSGPPGTYLLLFVLFLFPWSYFFVPAIRNLWEETKRFFPRNWKEWFQCNHRVVFILSWLAMGWLFYEILPSKLPSYTLSVYPLMAILISASFSAVSWGDLNHKVHTINRIVHSVIGSCIALGMLFMANAQGNASPPAMGTGLSNQIFSVIGILLTLLPLILTVVSVWTRATETAIRRIFGVSMVVFLVGFSVFYYPTWNHQRDYGTRIAKQWHQSLVLRGEPAHTEYVDNLPIVLHSEIRLPSIVYSLQKQGVATNRFQILDSSQVMQALTGQNSAQRGQYLVPSDFLEMLVVLGIHSESVCTEFYSYESGRNLRLCWVIR